MSLVHSAPVLHALDQATTLYTEWKATAKVLKLQSKMDPTENSFAVS